MRSLRLRLLLGAMVGVSVALTVAGIVLVTIFETHVRQRYVKELDDHLLQLAAIVQVDEAGAVTLKHEFSDPAFQRPLSGPVLAGERGRPCRVEIVVALGRKASVLPPAAARPGSYGSSS